MTFVAGQFTGASKLCFRNDLVVNAPDFQNGSQLALIEQSGVRVASAPIMDGSAALTNRAAKRHNFRLRGLALPKEHGSWSILLEPLICGIAVAPSAAAPFIALLFVGGFLAHQPLRVCLTDLRNGRRMPHTVSAVILAALFLVITIVGLVGTWRITGFSSLVPLLAAAPLAVLQLGYDLAAKSRRAIPEIAGAVALSSSAAITAHAAGWSSAAALALWCVFACRLIPSLLYVRNRLLLEKRKASSVLWPVLAHFLALAAVFGMASVGSAPKLAVFAFFVLLVRAAIGLSPWRLKLRAMQIGLLEITFGAITVLSVVIGQYLHF